MSVTTTIEPEPMRNTELDQLVTRLRTEADHKLDIVAPAAQIRSTGGLLHISDPDDGTVDIAPGPIMLATLADRLNIPVHFAREVHAETTGNGPRAEDYANVFDLIVNTRLAHNHTNRSWLVRSFTNSDDGAHYGRAMLSDAYRRIDNLDVLLAITEAAQRVGTGLEVTGADLTETRMRVRFRAPEITARAERFMAGYRSPFRAAGEESPVVFAGIEVSNSETGGGAFTIVPRLEAEICSNGMRITRDLSRSVHLGGRLEHGTVRWSEHTQAAAVDLAASKTADSVRDWLTPGYVADRVAEIETRSGAPVDRPVEAVTRLRTAAWTDADVDSILNLFTTGGQPTVGGLVNAITAHAQRVQDPEHAAALETQATSLVLAA